MDRCKVARACVALIVGCGPRVGFDEASSGDATSAADDDAADNSATSSMTGEDSTTTPDDEGDSGATDVCPPVDPDATLSFTVDFPGNEPYGEGGLIERHVRCTPNGGTGSPGYAELFLLCDERDGQADVDYSVAFEVVGDPFIGWLDFDRDVDLDYRLWWSFEVGSGQALRMAQDAVTHLVAYEDSVDGGLVGICATPPADARTRAEQWLDHFPALLQPGMCDDPAPMRLMVPTNAGNRLAYPGTQGELDNVSYVFEQGRCDVHDQGAEAWHFSAALWR